MTALVRGPCIWSPDEAWYAPSFGRISFGEVTEWPKVPAC